MRGLAIAVIKAVRSPARPASVREPMLAAAALPEVSACLPDGAEAAVRLTGDRELRRLNRDFLGEDHATDVLAFPAGDGGAYLGDIAISWPAVLRQASSSGHEPEAELGLLAVHGLLHLLGWDHASAPEQEEITRLTVAALEQAGVRLAPGRI